MGVKSVVVWVCITLSLMNVLQISLAAAHSQKRTTTTTRHFKWEVGYILWSPDCVENLMIGINGAFPGPTIRANAGDNIVVELKNGIPTEEIVLHWHGIRQFGTPWDDGAAGASQCAIRPGESFVYNFTVDKAGTFFYHGHNGMQRAAGLYGSLIVDLPKWKKEPFHYNEEFNFLLSDWFHQNVFAQMVGLDARPVAHWVGDPQSVLINGRGQFNCSLHSNTCSSNNTQCAPVVLNVQPNKTYRLRIASVTSVASLNLAIGGHSMTVVEADGNYVEPFSVSDMDIYSGDSYSVIITTNANPSSNYWISVGVRALPVSTPPALAILNYLPNSPSTLPSSPPPITPKWDDYAHSKNFSYKIFSRKGTPKPPTTSQRLISLLSTQSLVNGYSKWSINNISLAFPTTPFLGAIFYGLNGSYSPESPPDNFPTDYDVMKPPLYPNSTQGSYIYKLEYKSTVDVILQNAKELVADMSEIHPWHLHGHDFWVLGYGDGRFNEMTDVAKFNLNNPPLRNTVVMFPYGWTAIRFVADNPGVWPFHCHIEPHLYTGMGVVFAEGVDRLKDIPNDAMQCGMTGEMLINKHHN